MYSPTANTDDVPRSPRLPFDLIRLIAIDAAGEANEPEEREVARAVSLVCRSLRDVGQGLLWEMLTLPHWRVEVDEEKEEMQRLLRLVRHLRWEEEEEEFDDAAEAQVAGGSGGGRTADKFGSFLNLIARLGALTAVEATTLPFSNLLRTISALTACPSCGTLRSLTLGSVFPEGEVPSSPMPLRNEVDLLLFLHLFPALSSFSGNFHNLPFPPHHLPSPLLPHLVLRHLSLGVDSYTRPNDTILPSQPYHLLLKAIRHNLIRTATFGRSSGHDGWVRWIGQPAFSSLTTLNIVSTSPPLADFLPLLSRTLTALPALRHLQLRDESELGTKGGGGPEAFRTFLHTLPPSLQTVDFLFEASFSHIEDYLKEKTASDLRRIQCRLGLGHLVFQQTERGWEEARTNLFPSSTALY